MHRFICSNCIFSYQELRAEKLIFSKWETMVSIVNMRHLAAVSPAELPCEYLLQSIMETDHPQFMILLLFGWKMWPRAVSRPVSCKVARVLEGIPQSIGLHSKAPNQVFIKERPVLPYLLLEQNAVGLHFPRWDVRLKAFSFAPWRWLAWEKMLLY